MMRFNQQLNTYVNQAEAALAEDLSIPALPEAVLREAMAYSLSAGGKRFRPVLVYAVGALVSLPVASLHPFARALEMIHTYSLIHDDLPAMDNDDLRRGKPTNHKVFGEAMAILAGDALLNRAYEVMLSAASAPGLNPDGRLRAVAAAAIVANAAGAEGMVGGQVLDMIAEQAAAQSADASPCGQSGPDAPVRSAGAAVSQSAEPDGAEAPAALARLCRTHAMKTGALIHAAVMVPVVLAGRPASERDALAGYADQLGVAFQIRDDLLDVQGTQAALGKPIGSDQRNGKATYVTLLGVNGARQALAEATERALGALAPFGERAAFLADLARFVAEREH
jgi:geranylgeranyl diphosphate synthase type II